MFKSLFYATVLYVFSSLFTLSSAHAETNYDVDKVTEGIYYHKGVHEDPAEANEGAIGNVGFIIGEKCVAVIDAGGSYIEGTHLRREIRNITNLPICYVINSHVHPDHNFGNAAFKQDKPVYIAHEKLPAAMMARKEFFARSFAEQLGKAFTGTEFIEPSKTVPVGEPLIIDLGNRPLKLTAYPTAHTDHDLTVLDMKTKSLWTGDLLFIERIPALDGSINGWIAIMESLQKMDLNFVIPGHGPASCDLWQQGLKDQLRYFTTLRDEIRVILSNLGTIEEASKQVGQSEKGHWELFDLYHRRNITASFVELEWE